MNLYVVGMGKEVENLIMENNELLATKWVYQIKIVKTGFLMFMVINIPNKVLKAYKSTMEYGVHGITPSKHWVRREYPRQIRNVNFKYIEPKSYTFSV